MPSESLWMVVAVLAVFGFFATAMVLADMTWHPSRREIPVRSNAEKRP